MGKHDNRRSPKMRRKISQRKLKTRLETQAKARGEARKTGSGKASKSGGKTKA